MSLNRFMAWFMWFTIAFHAFRMSMYGVTDGEFDAVLTFAWFAAMLYGAIGYTINSIAERVQR